MAWFAMVSLVVTSVLALLTWHLSTGYMIAQREHGAVQQAMLNARLVNAAIERDRIGLDELITGLGADVESAVLLLHRGQWISSGNSVDPKRLPKALIDEVRAGQAAHQRVVLDGAPVLAVGLPLRGAGATYFEVFPLRELDRTFEFLSWMLVIGTIAATVFAALLGRWAATSALRPLQRLTAAAAAAAAGDLSVRLPATRDPDLAPLAGAFNDTAEKLQARVRRDTRFAGDVSHELRSPLTTMINAMAVLQRRRDELPDSAQQAVQLLDADLRRFRRMVDDLLEISRTDREPGGLDLELLDLSELVRQAAAEHHRGLRADVFDLAATPMVLADRRCLERVVANLVDNAEHHGGGLVRFAVLADGTTARIEVDDAGPGVPDTARDRIFERFARGAPGDRDGADRGAGLGLALVAQHVRGHEGRVWVTERPGGGARFVVELPEVQR
jgi:two-component system, OmpR family, sensor histidine kinase MtrB